MFVAFASSKFASDRVIQQQLGHSTPSDRVVFMWFATSKFASADVPLAIERVVQHPRAANLMEGGRQHFAENKPNFKT